MTTATRSALHTPLCERLGIRYPICQAGMAFVARAQLAAAVSAAGGLGVIAAAHGTATDLREEIRRVRDPPTSLSAWTSSSPASAPRGRRPSALPTR
jgi:NAD(P)H-dependent flavin oxidoreductase YrpB (nitropropane dioxygenase family)